MLSAATHTVEFAVLGDLNDTQEAATTRLLHGPPGADRTPAGCLMEAVGPVRTLTVVGDVVGVDPDDEAYLFKMSPASAEQVTIQIRSMLERAWEFIAIAYQGRAFLALGYETWDEYVDDRLGDLRLAVPREERAQAVATLSDASMSLRAIAKVLGIGLATAYRDLAGAKPEPDGAGEDAGPIGVRGRDGKQYPKRKKAADVECALCGETHPPGRRSARGTCSPRAADPGRAAGKLTPAATPCTVRRR